MVLAELSVEITIDNQNGKFPVKLDTVSFKKSIDLDNKVHHFIANNQVSSENYYHFLELGGLGRLKNLCLLSFRKLEEIVNMSGEEIYEAIKELTGAKMYEDKKLESVSVIEKTEAEQNRSLNFLHEIRDKLELLRTHMREYQNFEKNTDEINAIQFLINERKLLEMEEKVQRVSVSETNERMALIALEPKIEGGSIAVSARREGDNIVLDVVDSGVGLKDGSGFGLTQVRERLQATYGNHAAIYLGAGSAGFTRASITFLSKNG